jgi:hypothetical protein
MNKLFFYLTTLVIFVTASCATNKAGDPSWYISPKENNAEHLYGVAEGYNLEESTKYALADAASRLMVTISSQSDLLREENQTSANEEMRQQVRQNVEKINFTGFKVTRSQKIGQKFFTEVQIERTRFITEQKERIIFLERQISDLDKNSSGKNSSGKNSIQRRNALLQISTLSKEIELKSRIISGAGENIDLTKKLNRAADFQNQLEKLSDNIEFYFEINSPKEITKIIRTALNKEKIKISPSLNNSNPNQVIIKITSTTRSSEIYSAFMTKLEIDFENIAGGNVVASNIVEVTGSSAISEHESYLASLSSLEEKIAKDGILKIVGISK